MDPFRKTLFTKFNQRRHRRKEPFIICSECNGLVDLKEDIVVRDVADHAGIREMGMQCRSCGHWYHVFFEDKKVRSLREAYIAAREKSLKTPPDVSPGPAKIARKKLQAFREYLDTFNADLRDELGIRETTIGPTEL